MLQVLSSADVEQFIESGFVRVASAFDPKDAMAAQKVVWQHLAECNILENDPSTWRKPLVRLNEGYNSPEFERCNAERLANAMEVLAGRGRLKQRSTTAWGWWPVNFFVGGDSPWDVHWDGQHFRHYVDSPEPGLLVLCVFSEIQSQGGGTVVADGSHRVVSKYLNANPEGMDHKTVIAGHPWLRALTASEEEVPASPAQRIAQFMETTVDDDEIPLRVVDTTANPGDVILCHPFVFHATSHHRRRVPRFMCNRTAELRERMHIRDAVETDQLSPVEISIRRGLG